MLGRRSRRATVAVTVVSCAFAGIALLAPAHAVAVDADLKHAFAFKVEASNGYSIIAFAANERADGWGEIALFVTRGDEGAMYIAPAVLTHASVRADLGALGKVALDVVASGRRKKLRSRCGELETVTYEPQRYNGRFEFHGEEGYADAVTDAPREYTRFFSDLICAGTGGGESFGPGLPGARLVVRRGEGHDHLELRVFENRPGARAFFEAESTEKRGRIEIQRSISGRAPSDSLDYDPLLRSATLRPPAPFSGHASFDRNASSTRRWRGNLTVDFPGRSNVSLVTPGVRATLVHARRENSHLAEPSSA